MNDNYNPLDFKSNEELAEAFITQSRRARDYFKREIEKELIGSGVDPKYSRRFKELRTLNQLFPPSFLTKNEQIEFEWLDSAMFEITHSGEPKYRDMRWKLECLV
jgi:hypothetical protein